MLNKVEFLPIVLILVAIAFIAQTEATPLNTREAIIRSALVRQFLDRYVPPEHLINRRFDLSMDEEPKMMAKRNNAELVNHIIKNFGAINRLGDVGK